MWSAGRAFVLVAAAVFAACSLPSSDDFAHPSAETTEDGGAPKLDAGAQNDAAPASVDAGLDAGSPITNLLAGNTSDFEFGDCSGSGGYHATETGDPTAHSGGFSCRVCRAGSDGTAFTIDTSFIQNPTIGAIFHAFAWVRTAPGASITGPVAIILRTNNPNSPGIQQSQSQEIALTDAWQKIAIQLQVTQASSSADVYVTSDASDAACFLIDDFTVWQTGP